MPFCTQCGNRNPDDAKFCAQCGSRLVAPDAGPAPAAGPADARAPDTTGSTPAVADSSATITFGVPASAQDSGEQRQLLDDADAAAVDALPRGSALLVVQRGPGAGNRFLLDQDIVTAGRHPESEIFLDDITVSRRHVEFRRTPEGYTVSDVGSLNGTYVNRDRIDESTLQNGDEVQVGKFRLVYFAGDAAADH
ncbi:MAG: zinc-ribbon and FHA domain-containing protein [Actinomycetota bacterium]|nr:zinc-ribbon and FHA domain-containing protein [Actinomycetota bacterium]